MYGLILRALQGYVVATFGPDEWECILCRAGLSGERFEPLLSSGPGLLHQVLDAAAAWLGRPASTILADAGTFAVASPAQPAIRRLLHFGGATFEEFLHSLEELPDRARLALPEFDFPRLELSMTAPGAFRLRCHGYSGEPLQVMLGGLRAMADEYGALAVIELTGEGGDRELSIRLPEARLSEGRRFDLVSTG